jgi:Xaa-Pro aminopeptidase
MLVSLYVAERKEKFGEILKVEEILTPERKQEFMSFLSFSRRTTGAFDTRVVGLGVDYWVGDIQNTLLKGPLVAGLIPTVAERTQGEVISFANGAIEKLAMEGGIDVIVEGRAQTLDFVDSEHRFELVLNDDEVVGKRRAAQLVGAAVEKACEKWENRDARSEEVVEETYKQLKVLAA